MNRLKGKLSKLSLKKGNANEKVLQDDTSEHLDKIHLDNKDLVNTTSVQKTNEKANESSGLGEGEQASNSKDTGDTSKKKKVKNKAKKEQNPKNSSVEVLADENITTPSTENVENSGELQDYNKEGPVGDSNIGTEEITDLNKTKDTKNLQNNDVDERTQMSSAIGGENDAPVKKKEKKKLLSFLRKKSDSSKKKDRDKVKDKTNDKTSEELNKDPSAVIEDPPTTTAKDKPGHKCKNLQNTETTDEDQDSDQVTTQIDDIISETMMSQTAEQSKGEEEIQFQNTNDKGEDQTNDGSVPGKESIKADKEMFKKNPQEDKKSRFKLRKQSKEYTTDSEQQQSPDQIEDITSKKGLKKSKKSSKKTKEVPKDSETDESMTDGNGRVNKEEDRKKKRKSSKVFPADFFMVGSAEGKTDNGEESAPVASTATTSSEEIDDSDVAYSQSNCAIIIPPNTDEKQQGDKKLQEVKAMETLQLLTMPIPPWTPNEYVEESNEDDFIDCYWLYNKMSDGLLCPFRDDPSALFILDARDEEAFNQKHIAFSKLAKKFVTDHNEGHNESWPILKYYTQIILYDDNGLSLSLTDSILSQILDILHSKGIKALLLKNGYAGFHQNFSFMCVPKSLENCPEEKEVLDYPSLILKDRLYLGRGDQATNENIIKNLQITHVVNVSTEWTNEFEERVTYMNIPVKDEPSSDLQSHFLKAIQFIHDALNFQGHVLVHCTYGESRSATIVIAYLMMTRKWSASDAAKFVSVHRPLTDLNRGFLKQLSSFEKKLFGKKVPANKSKKK